MSVLGGCFNLILASSFRYLDDDFALECFVNERLDQLADETGIPLQQLDGLYGVFLELRCSEDTLFDPAIFDGASPEDARSEVGSKEAELLRAHDMAAVRPFFEMLAEFDRANPHTVNIRAQALAVAEKKSYRR
jgi:hypothetical protein